MDNVSDFEERACIQEKEKHDKQIQFNDIYNDFLKKTNSFLQSKRLLDAELVMELFEDDNVVSALEGINDFYIMNFIMNVYMLEIQNESDINICMLADNVKDMCDIFQYLKYLVWRIEFWNSDEDAIILAKYVLDNKITILMLYYLVEHVSYNEAKVISKLSDVFYIEKDIKAAIAILISYSENHSEKEVLVRLINILEEIGYSEKAMVYRRNYEQ